MRYFFSILLMVFFVTSAQAQAQSQASLRVLAWTHGVTPASVEQVTKGFDVNLNVDLYHTSEEMDFYLSQHSTKPYDILLLPEQMIRSMGKAGLLFTLPELGVIPKNGLGAYNIKYGVLVIRDHLAAVSPVKVSSWHDLFLLSKNNGWSIDIATFFDAIDALMIANDVTPSRFNENELMQVSEQIDNYKWSLTQQGKVSLMSYAEAVHRHENAYFPGDEARKTDYFYAVSKHASNANLAANVIEGLASKEGLSSLRYDGVSVFFDGRFHSPSNEVDRLLVSHEDTHTSQRMLKLKAIMENVLHDSTR